jgi:glycosyltransferase involved in cell wall biosynthesis/GT2 family glycosyltransferase
MSRRADVIIPVYRGADITRACIESVLEHTGHELGQLIVIDDHSPDPEVPPMLAALRARHPDIIVLRNEVNLGFVGTANRGLGLRQRDAVLLNSDTRVTAGWLTEMLEVAYASDRISAVVPLSNNATICSVPDFCGSTLAEELEDVALELGPGLPRWTEVPTGVGFCLLLKHTVLNMIGELDPAFGRGYNEENDWAMRAQRLGFFVARANHALVYHLGSVSFGAEQAGLEQRNALLLAERHPHYPHQVRSFFARPDARVAAHYVRRRLGTLNACIEGSHLGGLRINGTGVYAAELVKALVSRTSWDVAVRVGTRPQHEFFESIGIRTQPADAPLTDFQVYHRPSQVFNAQELSTFLDTPCHAVISYQDLIAYRAPSVFNTFEDYSRYRALSFAALHSAQAIIAISEHNRREIIEEFGLAPERVRTVHHGVDATLFQKRNRLHNREVLENHGLSGRFFLYAGSDYAHKNLRLLLTGYALFRSQLPRGVVPPGLILIGPPSRSRGGLYHGRKDWPAGVRYLGALEEGHVRTLFQEALAFIYPTVYEGFGLPVVEAMAAGTPLIASSMTSIPELAGDAALYLNDFSPEEVARHLLTMATSSATRTRLRAAGLKRVRNFTWSESARKTADVYLEVIDRPVQQSLFQRQMFSQLFGLYTASEAKLHGLQEQLAARLPPPRARRRPAQDLLRTLRAHLQK